MALSKSKKSRDCSGKDLHMHSGGTHFESRPNYRRSFLCSSSVPVVQFTQAARRRQSLPDSFRPNTPVTTQESRLRRYENEVPDNFSLLQLWCSVVRSNTDRVDEEANQDVDRSVSDLNSKSGGLQ
jgi:hypothetical protein